MGANWDTVEQLLFRESEDAGANICNPGFTGTPLTTWEEQVKAASLSDTGVGAVTFVGAASVEASAFVAALATLARRGLSRRAVVRRGASSWRPALAATVTP